MMKPGWKTTEFWLSLAAVLLGAAVASGLLDAIPGKVDDQIVAFGITVLAALGYTASRTFKKVVDAKTEAAVIVNAGEKKEKE